MSPRPDGKHRPLTWVPGPPPWAGGPPPWAGSGSGERWTTLEYHHSWVADTLFISLRTDIPCHLWLYWTEYQPLMHLREKTRRGVNFMSIPDYCLVNYHIIEQNEAGDTEWHTFDFNTWPDCEFRYWFYKGQEGGVASPSTSPIYRAHKPDYTEEESMRHIDLTHKEVAGVIDHADDSVTKEKIVDNLDGVSIGLNADKVDGKHASQLPNTEACRVKRTGAYNIGNATWTPIPWQAEEFDTDIMWAPADPTKVRARTAGKYAVHACFGFSGDSAGDYHVALVFNAALHIAREYHVFHAGEALMHSLSTIWDFATPDDYVELWIFQSSGSSKSCLFEDPYLPHLAMHRLS